MSWKEVRNWIPFWITAVFLAVICFSLPLFGDDYSYAQYMRGGFSAFLSEMKTHYLTVNGRTLIHFLDVLLLQGDGWPARVFVWLCSLGVILSSGAFLSGGFPKKETRETFGRAVAACSAGFWIISIWILRESVFWFTGALNYLFPALCVLLALTSLRSGQEGEKRGRLFPVFALLCAFLSEFSAIAAILICLYDGVGRSVKEKKVSPRLLWALLCALCSLSVFLAPGNAVRTAYYPDFYELSLPARVLSQLQEGCEVYLTDKGLLSVLCALLLVRGVLAFERKSRGRILPALTGFCGLFTVLSEGLDLYARADVRLLAVFPVMGTVFVLADMASEKEWSSAGLVFLASGLTGSSLANPVFGPRIALLPAALLLLACGETLKRMDRKTTAACLLPALCLFLPTGWTVRYVAFAIFALLAVLVFLFRKKAPRAGAVLAFCLALLWALPVVKGYAENGTVFRKNEQKLKNESEETVFLERPGNGLCKYTYYLEGSPWHDGVFLDYYGIKDASRVKYLGE